ncbi:DNA-directed DNA polymerase, family A, palm domain [Vibrio phage 1.170.O._10N.261.52.C3]|nr:DNA-directed DNA polymerase, family A, palm domain [Vibrio phage 1.170.O._10N.261.52.C3]
MKEITNWRKATVFDIEADGLLDSASMFHVLSFHMANGRSGNIEGDDHTRLIKFFNYHLDNKIPLVVHNGIGFDIPLSEKLLGIDLSELMVIDTLGISWYLNTKRKIHGLDSFLEDYGIEKPKVGEAEWVKPIRGIGVSMRTEGKGKDKVKILTYKYLNEPSILSEDYHEKGINLGEEDLKAIGLLETEESYTQRLKEHKELMFFRCSEDVKINLALWQDCMKRLHEMYSITKNCVDSDKVNPKRMSRDEVTYLDQYVDISSVESYIDRCLTFLMFKMDCARLQERTRWKLDLDYLYDTEKELEKIVKDTQKTLVSVMPPVAKYGTRKKPEDPLKKDNTPKQATLKWNHALEGLNKTDDFGNPLTKLVEGNPNEVKVINKYEDPNANSSDQLKNFFFMHGWKPKTFKYVKSEEEMEAWVKGGFRKEDKPKPRAIPQINTEGDNGKELCESVMELAEEVPEIAAYNGYSVAKHRYDTVKGFIRDMSKDGYLQARIGGFTNTLRVKHREIVNLVGVDKPYGENVRGSLTCKDGEILLGSDLSSLEDRVKHHFMLPHDPDYVATMMADDYDPHILTAHSAGMVSDEELKGFKEGFLTGAIKEAVGKARKGGKCTNYASVYGGSPEAISRSAGIEISLAKQLHEGYWKLNWSVKAIAEEQCVFEDSRKQKWLINPVNGICYSLRTEKDRFSTLCQGTGSFFFDMWVDRILETMKSKWGRKTLTGSFHDEIILCFKDLHNMREIMEDIVLRAIDYVSNKYLLRRKLGADVQFDKRYSGIH